MNRFLLMVGAALAVGPAVAQTPTSGTGTPTPRPATTGSTATPPGSTRTTPSPGTRLDPVSSTTPTATPPAGTAGTGSGTITDAATRTGMAPGTTGQSGMTTGTDLRAGMTRLDRDLRALGTSSDATRYRTDYDALRRDYDALGTGTDAATQQHRMDLERRYEDLDATVASSRMRTAPRAEYFRMADDRLRMYDDQVAALRQSYATTTGESRADLAMDLIRLRRQQDLFRDEAYGVRGAGASGFEAARASARANLDRYDADFRTARREAMMRGMDAPSGTGTTSGTMPGTGTTGTTPRPSTSGTGGQ